MKIKVEWRREYEGVSEVDVPTEEVLAWLNDPVTGGPQAGTWTAENLTAKEHFEWLQSGDDDVWMEQIDVERDAKTMPWNEVELERLHRERV